MKILQSVCEMAENLQHCPHLVESEFREETTRMLYAVVRRGWERREISMTDHIVRNQRTVLLFATAVIAMVGGATVASADDLLVSEFFEEILSIDTDTGSVTDLVDSPVPIGDPFGQHLAVGSGGTIFVTGFDDLYAFTPGASSPYELKMSLSSGSFTALSRDHGGDLIAINGSAGTGVLRVNPESGSVSVVHEEAFFGPSDAVVDAAGRVFITEFFDSLGYIPASGGGFVPIGDFGSNEFTHLDIGTDGQIYVSTLVERGFARVDPATGQMTTIASDVFTFIDDFQIADDNTLYFTGSVDSVEGLYRLNAGIPELIVGDNTITFFNPLDLAVGTGFRTTHVPEPSSLILAMVGAVVMRRRRLA